MTPRILLLSATTGYQLRSFNDAASRLGVDLAFATDRCHTLDDPWQDAAVPVRFHHEDEQASLAAIREAARERPFDGVIAVGDRPTMLAARAAEMLGLPWHPPHAVRDASSKLRSRSRFAEAGLITPWFWVVPGDLSAEEAARDPRVTYPCIVKPTHLSGSRGVIRADDPAGCAAAVRRVRDLLARPDIRALRQEDGQQIMIEGFIPGHEFAIEGLVTRGRFQSLAIFDKPDPLDGPFFEETIYVTPPPIDETIVHAIVDTIGRAVEALQLRHGPVHAECRVDATNVVMLEIAPRPIGGLCSRVLRLVTGEEPDEASVSLEEVLLRHALSEPAERWRRERQAAAVMMIPIPERGRLKRVDGEGVARAVAHVEDVRITARRDQLLEPLPEAGSYLGFIFARALTPEIAEEAVRIAHRHLSFVVEAPISVSRG